MIIEFLIYVDLFYRIYFGNIWGLAIDFVMVGRFNAVVDVYLVEGNLLFLFFIDNITECSYHEGGELVET